MGGQTIYIINSCLKQATLHLRINVAFIVKYMVDTRSKYKQFTASGFTVSRMISIASTQDQGKGLQVMPPWPHCIESTMTGVFFRLRLQEM